MVVMFYKVTTNTELEISEPWLLGKYSVGSCEPLVTTFLSTYQYITCFMCVCFKGIVLNIYCLLTLNS